MSVLPARFTGHRLGDAAAPVVVQLYMDYNCPFCKKSFLKFVDEVIPHYDKNLPGKVQFWLMHQIQPWHAQSLHLAEAALAVERLNPAAVWSFSRVLYDKIEQFSDRAVVNKSRSQLNEELADLAAAAPIGVDRAKFLELLALVGSDNNGNSLIGDVKWWVRYSRQLGIHMSPTVQVNGIIEASYGSAWSLEQITDMIAPFIAGTR
ncbi:hypothetical protein CAOG_05335 [Capsaspora owczarzaki ATCC 30864]|uniref:Thioredoxin-like fold domain-containing protein n=1 Tax=Capsaspora owczarzaki (strain ATCC 30864) TaxID=595528 RepID=A0A0D2UI08_CAPO3|nr:hypothetical protein CAOG_05335 [Capsaspora owczarzaki ATCC 30864]KJE94746.1 hypothetical protein CAOG_005335 [Capsaspora owczarzaki ATCC 30864]|eukprot:XP_004347020.1 hypothetical protein CAOG_05335 [Capsaspora owczarzaki ATCC 30864]